MKYFVKNSGEVSLDQKDFIAAGGFGKVYKKGTIAYKIYSDSSNMLPVGKITELSVLTDKDIVKPVNLIFDKNQKELVGYTMRFVKGFPLCEIFTNTYKKRNNITNKMCLNLLEKFYSKVDHIHEKNVLIVDCNELNFLVSDDYLNIYPIDTDGYQTPSYKATGIMDNIRDRHCNNHFTKETDWFSWGILASQVLLGIHPYKGGHPDFDSLDPADRMNARMMKNISILNSKARLPGMCPPIENVIPSGLRQWMAAVYEKGERIKPPKDFNSLIVIAHPSIQKIKGANLFDINLLKSFDEEISDFYSLNGDSFIVLKRKMLFNNKEYQIPSGNCFVTYFNQINRPVAFSLINNKLSCLDVVNNKPIAIDLECSNLFKVDDRIYCTQNNKLLQLNVEKVGQVLFCKTNVVGNVLDLSNATKCFDSVLVQNMLGRYYFSILPKSGECYQVPVKELDGFKIINAKLDKSVLIVSAIDLKGNKCRFTIKLHSNYVNYTCSVKNNVQSSEINFCVNDSGICVMINEEEKVEIFTSNPTSNSVKILDDPSINGNMILTSDGPKILFYNDKDLYSFSIKK
jgi:hypothetical protein